MSLKCPLITIIENSQQIWQKMPPEMHALIPTESNKSNLAVFQTRSSNRHPLYDNNSLVFSPIPHNFLSKEIRERQHLNDLQTFTIRIFVDLDPHTDAPLVGPPIIMTATVLPCAPFAPCILLPLSVFSMAIHFPNQMTQLRCQVMLNRLFSRRFSALSRAPRAPTPRSGLSPSPQSSDPPLSDPTSSHG